MSEDRFTDVTFDEIIERRIARHEILMSFRNDSDAVDFYRWWNEEGSKIFQEWLDS